MKKIVQIFLTVAMFVIAAFAQTPTGSLVGTVSSTDGVLPGATVEIKYDLTGRSQTATTNSSGVFSFAQLEPGNYTLTITAKGFKTFVANEVKIDIGREFNIAPVLEVGGIEESVTVTSGADIVTSTTGQISTTVSTQQILNFPLLTRNPIDLVASQPGVQTSAYQNTTINGMRTSATNITRDGISINDPFIRSNATDFAPGRPSVDDTSEITIITGVQEADSGGGAQIQVLTPRGTSDFHGALFAYNRNSAFAANNFFNNRSGVERPFRNRNQFGGKIGGQFPLPNFGEGGPVVLRDKGFFFFSYEGIRDPVSSRYTRTILTPAARAGAFTFLRAAAGNPINSGGISCPSGAVGSSCTIANVLTFAQSQGLAGIPGTINPVIQSRILNPMPTTGNFTGLGDGVNTTGFALNRSFATSRNTYTARVDVDVTSKDSVNFVYSWNREDVLRPDVDDTGFSPSPDVTQYAENLQLTAAYRRIIRNNLVNDFRWGQFTNEVPFDRISEYPDFFIGSGVLPTTTGGAPLLGGIITNPTNVFMDQGRNNKVTTFADNANWILGNHSLKFGGLYQKYEVKSYNDFGIVQHYHIGTTNVSTATSTTLTNNNFANVGGAGSIIDNTQLGQVNGLLAILGGLVSSSQQAFNLADIQSGYVRGQRQLAPFINWNHALYVADRCQIRPGLTFNAGVRWEIYPALRLDNGLALEAIVDQNDPAASLLAGNGNFNVVGTNAGQEYRFYKTDRNNFAPSLSIAWVPNFDKGIGNFLFGNQSRTVLRAGYSHVYANDQIITALNNTITSAATGNIGLGRQTLAAIGPAGNTQLNLRAGDTQQIPTPVFTGANRTFLQNSGAAQSFFGNAGAIDPNLQIPMIKQYSVGIQRELPWKIAVEARYVGTSSNNLLRSYNLNEIDVVNNGFLADFRRAQANLALTGSTAFCNPATVTGCQPLTLFRSGAIGTGPLVVGTSLTAATFNTQLRKQSPHIREPESDAVREVIPES
ncbi:MAG: carboxypeptidase regulatory-like domain-containing protein [Pyrinomonadaceae bacterium]